MRATIYTKYSSENQSEKIIDKQVRVCQKYIEANGLVFNEKQIYTDEAVSGAIHNKQGLQALVKGDLRTKK